VHIRAATSCIAGYDDGNGNAGAACASVDRASDGNRAPDGDAAAT
jgi:hypothetical protein